VVHLALARDRSPTRRSTALCRRLGWPNAGCRVMAGGRRVMGRSGESTVRCGQVPPGCQRPSGQDGGGSQRAVPSNGARPGPLACGEESSLAERLGRDARFARFRRWPGLACVGEPSSSFVSRVLAEQHRSPSAEDADLGRSRPLPGASLCPQAGTPPLIRAYRGYPGSGWKGSVDPARAGRVRVHGITRVCGRGRLAVGGDACLFRPAFHELASWSAPHRVATWRASVPQQPPTIDRWGSSGRSR
jgi:hypothetical protein